MFPRRETIYKSDQASLVPKYQNQNYTKALAKISSYCITQKCHSSPALQIHKYIMAFQLSKYFIPVYKIYQRKQ